MLKMDTILKTFVIIVADLFSGFVNPGLSHEDCAAGRLQSYNGTVKLSVIMSLRKPEAGVTCGPIVESQLQVLAAVQWAVERINANGLLPFATLGMYAYLKRAHVCNRYHDGRMNGQTRKTLYLLPKIHSVIISNKLSF